MTLTIGELPPMTVGAYAAVPITITGPSPVHAVAVDFPADGQPAWYFVPFDGRATIAYTIGPLKKKGRVELTARAVDEMGCEIANGVRVWAMVQ